MPDSTSFAVGSVVSYIFLIRIVNRGTFQGLAATGTNIVTTLALSQTRYGCPVSDALPFCFINILLIRIGSKPAF